MFSSKFLYQFKIPCRRTETPWSLSGCNLNESFRLPIFDELDGGNCLPPYHFRMAWSPQGIFFSLSVFGKSRLPWCRAAHPEESDGFQICLDTRDIKDIHRATRFCHRLIFLPTGGGPSLSQPQAFWLPIHRAKAHPNPIQTEQIRLRSEFYEGGYRLEAMIPREVLTGYEPLEYQNLGFHYVVQDHELGDRFFLSSPPLPHDQDPSIWASLELVN